jgi:phage gp36-like protein
MSQNLLEVVENLHAAVSADPNNTDNDKAIIQALQQAQQALEQKKKKQVHFDGVEMPPMRKEKALDSILKHPDQAGAAKESAADPSAPVSHITISTPVITTTAARNIPTAAVKNTAAADTSGLQYRYSTPVEDPAVVLKVVNHALDIPISIAQRELLSISPEARKQYKELTMMRQVSAGTTEVGKLEEVPDDSPAVYSGCAIHDPDGTDDLRVSHDSIPLHSIFLLVEGKLTVECILDSGCQIVAMNSVIWEKLGNNLQVE